MKRLKHFGKSWLILGLLFAVAACNDKEDAFDVDADAVFVKKKINNETVAGIAYYAYGNQSLDSVEVVLPEGGGTVELEQFGDYTYTFVHDPQDGDFTTNFPAEGSYLFKVTSKKGEYLEKTDEQEFDNLDFAVIDSMGFNQSNNWFYVRWNEIDGADSYVVQLYKSGELIFNGVAVAADSPEYLISDYYYTGSWSEEPVKGEQYVLRIQSMKYDSDATNDNYIYNIQEVIVTEQEITWDLE